MKQLNLDDFGLEAFTPERLAPLMGWYRGKKHDPRKYKQRFNLQRGYNEKTPFVWLERLQDWRRLERVYNKVSTDLKMSDDAHWSHLKELWKLTKKQCGKRVEGFYLQELRPGKKTSTHVQYIHVDRNYNSLTMSHRTRSETTPNDASVAWIWLGTPEEEELARLHRRVKSCRARLGIAHAAFQEAVRIRLASWWKFEMEKSGDNYRLYSHRRVFTAIENEGRNYGWLSGIGGQAEEVYTPHDPPVFFK